MCYVTVSSVSDLFGPSAFNKVGLVGLFETVRCVGAGGLCSNRQLVPNPEGRPQQMLARQVCCDVKFFGNCCDNCRPWVDENTACI